MLVVRKSAAWWRNKAAFKSIVISAIASMCFDETDVNALFGADVVNAVRQENERLQ